MGYTTGKKDRIIEFLSLNAEHSYTLEQICLAVTEDGHGKSTVYRLVAELVDGGYIKRLSDGRTRHCTYQFVGDEECHEHLHLKCKECGRLVHLDDKLSHQFERAILRSGGFMIDEGAILFGRCRDCAEVKG